MIKIVLILLLTTQLMAQDFPDGRRMAIAIARAGAITAAMPVLMAKIGNNSNELNLLLRAEVIKLQDEWDRLTDAIERAKKRGLVPAKLPEDKDRKRRAEVLAKILWSGLSWDQPTSAMRIQMRNAVAAEVSAR